MKPLLYIGATLMIGAGIYGFVDFKKKGHSREFQSLYRIEPKKEVKEPLTTKPAPVDIADPMVIEKEDTVVTHKKRVAGSKHVEEKWDKVNTKAFSRGSLKEIELVEDTLSEPEVKVEQ